MTARLLVPSLIAAALLAPASAGAVDTPGTHQCLRVDAPYAYAYSGTHTTCRVAKPVSAASAPKVLMGRTHFTLTIRHRRWRCTSDGMTSSQCRSGLARVWMALA